MKPDCQRTLRICINEYGNTYEVIIDGELSAGGDTLIEALELALYRYYHTELLPKENN